MYKIKVGVIGCGVIAPYHIKGIKEVPQAELVAVCDERRKGSEIGQ